MEVVSWKPCASVLNVACRCWFGNNMNLKIWKESLNSDGHQFYQISTKQITTSHLNGTRLKQKSIIICTKNSFNKCQRVIIIRKPKKDRQHNGQKKKEEIVNS
jgi:hypothetical protein